MSPACLTVSNDYGIIQIRSLIHGLGRKSCTMLGTDVCVCKRLNSIQRMLECTTCLSCHLFSQKPHEMDIVHHGPVWQERSQEVASLAQGHTADGRRSSELTAEISVPGHHTAFVDRVLDRDLLRSAKAGPSLRTKLTPWGCSQGQTACL